jgi:DNA helicase HerA-like ATPase
MTAVWPNPIDDSRRVGTVTAATAQWVSINVPNAGSSCHHMQHGDVMPRGEVGEYLCFPRGDTIILGRITKVQLPERDRLSVEPRIGRLPPVDPTADVSLLTDVDLSSQDVTGSVNGPPRLGTPAYSASSAFLQWVLESSARKRGESTTVTLAIGTVAGAAKAPVFISPDRLFGRHCAILGVTGGGKSWTIARLTEECAKHKSKLILIDATGEFASIDTAIVHCSIGNEKDGESIEVACPCQRLEERDLFALFTPSGQSQAPTLREAIRSLKLAKCPDLPAGLINEKGCLPKAGKAREDYLKSCKKNIEKIESALANFDIENLSLQLQHECVLPSSNNDKAWGMLDQRALGYCMPLVMRVEAMVRDQAFGPIFRPGTMLGIQDRIDAFLDDETNRILRISLRYLSFAQSIRPMVVNAIGRHLLHLARKGVCRTKPVVVLLDEAHQFLGKSMGDEGNNFALDAFDLIAKEGRKYGLTVCLATQRPRDIQDGVLSQIGTMIVHRLTHGADREVVERAARDVEKSVATFLPTLAPGQAILLGADFPVPIPIQIREPAKKPHSKGPDYQSCWQHSDGNGI